jgi:hypothetical protein
MNDDDVVPRYLVLVDDCQRPEEYESEESAMAAANEIVSRTEAAYARKGRTTVDCVEVVLSVRRWELDSETGTMLEVGEKLIQPV